jgi:hypothetical protein
MATQITVSGVIKRDDGVQVLVHYTTDATTDSPVTVEAASCAIGADRYGCDVSNPPVSLGEYAEGDFSYDLTSRDSAAKGGVLNLLVDGEPVELTFGRASAH